MFGKLKNMFGAGKGPVILAPLSGEVVSVTDVSDPTFGEEILGRGVAIKPDGGRVVSPVNGTVTQMFDTGHAVSVTSDDGVEVLVHVGLDTIRLKGEGYTVHVGDGDKVQAGDLLMEFDREAIAAAGYDTITPVVVCNSDQFTSFELKTGRRAAELDELICLGK